MSLTTVTADKLSSMQGTMKACPNDVNPQDTGFYSRGRFDIQANATVGAGMLEFSTLFFGAGNPGYVRWTADHQNMYLAIGNPEEITEEDGEKWCKVPTALGNMILNNLTLGGTLNIKLPVFDTITSARKSLSEGQLFVTPAGYVRQLLATS